MTSKPKLFLYFSNTDSLIKYQIGFTSIVFLFPDQKPTQ